MTRANGDDGDDVARAPWIPGPRRAADDHADLTADPSDVPEGEKPGVEPEHVQPEPVEPERVESERVESERVESEPDVPVLTHGVLKSLLGAWALSACSPGETQAVEDHLTACAPCADEALRLRDAVALLHEDRDLDLDPLLRSRVLENCLGRRPARIPVPEWATPYDAETARLDALLRDIGESEWHAPVRLKWYEEGRIVRRKATVAGVIGHLLAVDGLVSAALGLEDPLGVAGTPELSPSERTEAYWAGLDRPPNRSIRGPWRDQSHTLIRTVSFAGRGVADLTVTYKDFALPLRDSLLERAFECWVHADDIANAVAYPYAAPSGAHLHSMIDLAARLLPGALANRRRTGLASPARHLVAAGAPGRSLHLEVEGAGGGHWYIALDSPAALGSPDRAVAQVAMDGVEFCQLVAGHISPEEAAAGQDGDREAIRDVLSAAASLSRL
ncbi:maleylpyruvate isomerase N-terminal domain-containing protein [Streptomyces sp. SJL17-1]|uniref:maleylpyruvate isomerase N-terminal domain-containing protein n=1 Tax=Streptomyces sp. SJL17-1 TaxID=2967223 RepID=UPI0029676DA3|nr:zf-HC2 domain-containing protein [Streptomyces sp. SJL17-1]